MRCDHCTCKHRDLSIIARRVKDNYCAVMLVIRCYRTYVGPSCHTDLEHAWALFTMMPAASWAASLLGNGNALPDLADLSLVECGPARRRRYNISSIHPSIDQSINHTVTTKRIRRHIILYTRGIDRKVVVADTAKVISPVDTAGVEAVPDVSLRRLTADSAPAGKYLILFYLKRGQHAIGRQASHRVHREQGLGLALEGHGRATRGAHPGQPDDGDTIRGAHQTCL